MTEPRLQDQFFAWRHATSKIVTPRQLQKIRELSEVTYQYIKHSNVQDPCADENSEVRN